MKPCNIRSSELSDGACRWLYKNFLIPNGVRHYVPMGSPLIINGHRLGLLTMDIERIDQNKRHWRGETRRGRWRPWRANWAGPNDDIPLKFRAYRIRRPLTNTEIAALYQHENWIKS